MDPVSSMRTKLGMTGLDPPTFHWPDIYSKDPENKVASLCDPALVPVQPPLGSHPQDPLPNEGLPCGHAFSSLRALKAHLAAWTGEAGTGGDISTARSKTQQPGSPVFRVPVFRPPSPVSPVPAREASQKRGAKRPPEGRKGVVSDPVRKWARAPADNLAWTPSNRLSDPLNRSLDSINRASEALNWALDPFDRASGPNFQAPSLLHWPTLPLRWSAIHSPLDHTLPGILPDVFRGAGEMPPSLGAPLSTIPALWGNSPESLLHGSVSAGRSSLGARVMPLTAGQGTEAHPSERTIPWNEGTTLPPLSISPGQANAARRKARRLIPDSRPPSTRAADVKAPGSFHQMPSEASESRLFGSRQQHVMSVGERRLEASKVGHVQSPFVNSATSPMLAQETVPEARDGLPFGRLSDTLDQGQRSMGLGRVENEGTLPSEEAFDLELRL